MNFLVRWWAGSKPLDMHQSRDGVVRAIKRALDGAGMVTCSPFQAADNLADWRQPSHNRRVESAKQYRGFRRAHL